MANAGAPARDEYSVERSCCFPLVRTADSRFPAVGVFFIHNGPRTGPDSAAVDLIGAAFLPAPAHYGTAFTGYGIALAPDQEPVAMALSQERPDGTGLWTFLFVSGAAGPFERARVTIAPLTADGRSGPTVAEGAGDCPFRLGERRARRGP